MPRHQIPLTFGAEMGRLLVLSLELHKDTLQISKRILLSPLRLGTKGRALKDRLNKPVSYIWCSVVAG